MQCAHDEEIIGVRSTTATIYKGFPGLRIVGITRVVCIKCMLLKQLLVHSYLGNILLFDLEMAFCKEPGEKKSIPLFESKQVALDSVVHCGSSCHNTRPCSCQQWV